jgi:hypothetical protein
VFSAHPDPTEEPTKFVSAYGFEIAGKEVRSAKGGVIYEMRRDIEDEIALLAILQAG